MVVLRDDAIKRRSHVKRKHVRYQHHKTSLIDIDLQQEGQFQAVLSGLLVDESHGGCSFVLLDDFRLERNLHVRIKLPELGIVSAQIRWRRQLDEDLIRIGLIFK